MYVYDSICVCITLLTLYIYITTKKYYSCLYIYASICLQVTSSTPSSRCAMTRYVPHIHTHYTIYTYFILYYISQYTMPYTIHYTYHSYAIIYYITLVHTMYIYTYIHILINLRHMPYNLICIIYRSLSMRTCGPSALYVAYLETCSNRQA